MPLILTTCKTCSTGGVPADADFCPNCGRRLTWTETPRGRRRAAVVAVTVLALIVAVTGAGLWVLAHASPHRQVVFRPAPVRRPPPPLEPLLAAPPVPPLPPQDVVTPTPATAPAATIPARPGDTDLTNDPLAAYAGGPNADRLSVNGFRLGLSIDDVPPTLLSDGAPDHLRDTHGNLYAVDADRISEVHVRDPDLLAHWPIDSTNDLVGHFGPPDGIATAGDNDPYATYLYPARGIHVRWDTAAGRIAELVLVRPTIRR